MGIEIIKIAVWPVAVVISCLIFCLVFKKPISDAISRIRMLKAKGIGIDLASQPTQKENITPDHFDLLVQRFATFIIPVVDSIDSMIATKKLTSQEEIIKLLKNHTALWFLAYQYEIIYHVVFGTQINLLQHLNAKPLGVTFQETEPFYRQSINLGLKNFSHEQYLSYLLSSGLIEQKTERYFLSAFGKGFLHFLVEANKDPNKFL